MRVVTEGQDVEHLAGCPQSWQYDLWLCHEFALFEKHFEQIL
jgi:hypothetical protein